MLDLASYGHLAGAGLRSDYFNQFGVRARIRSGSGPDKWGQINNKNRGQTTIFERKRTLFRFAWPYLALNVSYQSVLYRSSTYHSYEAPDPKMLRIPTSIRVELPSIGQRRPERPEFGLVGNVVEPPRAGRHSEIDLNDATELFDVGTFERRRIHPHRRITILFHGCSTKTMSDLFQYRLYGRQSLNQAINRLPQCVHRGVLFIFGNKNAGYNAARKNRNYKNPNHGH